jgi:hypothetical protein
LLQESLSRAGDTACCSGIGERWPVVVAAAIAGDFASDRGPVTAKAFSDERPRHGRLERQRVADLFVFGQRQG